MKISELKAGIGNVNVSGKIIELDGPRDIITKFGKKTSVSNAVLEDASGTIKLSLWEENADRFSIGDKVQIENGWVSDYKGAPQLGTGKFGKISKV